jgi:hypothetical protein
MEKGEKYLNGNISIGVLGQRNIAVFKNNKKKEGSNEPDWNITVREEKNDGSNYLKKIGALWITSAKGGQEKEQKQSGADDFI